MINKRGEEDSLLIANVVCFALFIITVIPIIYFVASQRDGAALWEEFYAEEIARIIDVASPKTEVYIEVNKATQIASRRKTEIEDIFDFSNIKNETIVKLRRNAATAFNFFNDVVIKDWNLEAPSPGADEPNINRLHFEIIERKKPEKSELESFGEEEKENLGEEL